MKKRICLNVGYYNTKVTRDGQTFTSHATRIQQNEDATQNYIMYNGSKYEVGVGSRDINNRDNNFTHLICTYYNVIKMAKDGEHIELIVALPISQFLNRDARTKYIDSIKSNSPLLCEVNGITKRVFIDNVVCYMEGASCVLANEELFSDCVCGVIDIGGNTVNGAVFNDLSLLVDTATTLDIGTIKLEKDIIDSLNVKKGWNVQDYEIAGLLKSSDKDVCKIVDDICTSYVRSIKNKLMEKKWSMGSLLLYFTGGGSLFLKKYIQKEFQNFTISDNCLYDNEVGLWAVKEALDVSEEEHFDN